MQKALALFSILLMILGSQTLVTFGQNTDECLVPCSEILNGGPGIDGIPSIDEPAYISKTEADQIFQDTDLVAGIVIDGVPRAYPYLIMNWHEIVNDEINGRKLALTYCPLTGSALLFDRDQAIGGAEFGVSGRLYQNNLVMYDRATMTYYSQMYHVGIKGKDLGKLIEPLPIIETTWRAWKSLYPNTVVLSTETGHSRDYSRSPYGNYDEEKSIYFPSRYDPSKEPFSKYHPKHKSVVIQEGPETHVIPFDTLEAIPAYVVEGKNHSYVIFYHSEDKLAVTFEFDQAITGKSFQKTSTIDSSTNLPLFEDANGNLWNLRGESETASEGLKRVAAFNAFWFAATSFYLNAFYHFSDGIVQYQTENPLGNQTFVGKVEEASFLSLPLVAGTLVFAVAVFGLHRRNKSKVNF
ncbi:MAG: DUF3179 domain-containing protein [Methanobacteriota archaeon]|nr:MAG: DUF3179 domain-containing protein [Euryarchaeota archaeon]